MSEKIIELTLMIMVLSFTFSVHEFMHAWVAEKMGMTRRDVRAGSR